MEHLAVSWKVVAPLLVLMLIGFLLRKGKVVSEEGMQSANKLVFYAGIPAIIIQNLLNCDIKGVVSWQFAVFFSGSLMLLYLLLLLLVPRFCKDRGRAGVLIQGLFRTNNGIFALVIGSTLLGEENISVLSFAVVLSLPFLTIFGTMALEIFSKTRHGFKETVLSAIKNPIMISVFVGIVLRFILEKSSLTLPVIIQKPLSLLSAMCSPLAFILLGGMIKFSSLKKNRKVLTLATILRLFVIPVIFVSFGHFLGFGPHYLIAVFLIFGSPSAISNFAIACRYDCDNELAAELIATTTVASLFSMFLAILLFSYLGWV